MKVFMTGATGFVGRSVLRNLLKDGHSVGCLTRKGSEKKYPEEILKKISIIEGDADDIYCLSRAVKEYDAIINLIEIIREFRGQDITFEKLHFEVTRNLVDAAKACGISRFIQMSALGTEKDAKSKYHQTKYKAEKYIKSQKMEYTIFRPSVIFGHNDHFVTILKKLIKYCPVVPVIGTGEYRMQPVHVDVLGQAFSKCLNMKKSKGKTYEVGGPHKIQYKQILVITGKSMGKDIKTFSPPVFMTSIVAILLEDFSFFPITRDMITMLEEESVCDDGENVFNYDFNIPQISYQKSLDSL